MSNINHDLKTILIHNPKAAGTPMYLAMNMEHGHDTQTQAREKHAKHWDEYYKFAFVRNPMDRMVSTYEFCRMEKSWYHDNVNGVSGELNDPQADYQICRDHSFEQVCRILAATPERLKHPGWRPQSHFINDPKDLDFLGRYENLEADWQKVCDTLGVNLPLEKINVSEKVKDRAIYYTPVTVAIATLIYKSDYQMFGYKLAMPSAAGFADWKSRAHVTTAVGHENVIKPPEEKKDCGCNRGKAKRQ